MASHIEQASLGDCEEIGAADADDGPAEGAKVVIAARMSAFGTIAALETGPVFDELLKVRVALLESRPDGDIFSDWS